MCRFARESSRAQRLVGDKGSRTGQAEGLNCWVVATERFTNPIIIGYLELAGFCRVVPPGGKRVDRARLWIQAAHPLPQAPQGNIRPWASQFPSSWRAQFQGMNLAESCQPAILPEGGGMSLTVLKDTSEHTLQRPLQIPTFQGNEEE